MKVSEIKRIPIIVTLDTSCYMGKDSQIKDLNGNFIQKDKIARDFVDSLFRKLSANARGKNFFDIAIIPYLKNSLDITLENNVFNNIGKLNSSSKKVKKQVEKIVNGRMQYQKIEQVSWFEPATSGADYIISALNKARDLATKVNQDYFPPIIINIIGTGIKGRKEEYKLIRISEDLKEISNKAGEKLTFFNIYLSDKNSSEFFPEDVEDLKEKDFEEVLFEMSSEMPEYFLENLRIQNKNLNFPDARCLAVNVEPKKIVELFDFEV